jgi:hypothetical protein
MMNCPRGGSVFIYIPLMAKMWDIRRREMHIQSEREKGKKTGNRIFQHPSPIDEPQN